MSVSEVLTTRVSADQFDPSRSVSDADIRALVEGAQTAPSSFNVQFTRFVAVSDPALRERLKAVAYGQPKIADASVVFVLLGDTRAHEDYAVRIRAAATAGYISVEVGERLAGMAMGFYSNPAAAREECLRSAGLSGMALMVQAEAMGLAACPMIGFDPEGFRSILGIGERYLPLMLVVVGYAITKNARKARLSVDEVLRINSANLPA